MDGRWGIHTSQESECVRQHRTKMDAIHTIICWVSGDGDEILVSSITTFHHHNNAKL